MKEKIITKKILKWYDINKRSLPWRKKASSKKKQYYTLVSEFMLQQTQVATVIPFFNRFIKNLPSLNMLANVDEKKLIKLWEGLGYYSRARNLKKTAKLIIKDFNKKIPKNYDQLKSLPGIGNYTASAIMAIAFNKPFIPLDGNIERVLKRYLYLKKDKEILKDNLLQKKSVLGISSRSSDYAQALMELGALICKPNKPLCDQCPIFSNCKSYKKKDFDLVTVIKKNKNKYFILKVYKKNQKYLLIKNQKFNFLKNLSIFPMDELSNPKNFNENLSFKISNMNMNIEIKYPKNHEKFSSYYWMDKKKLDSYMLPSFTKKVVKYLEEN
tara:strand:- start:195 stop:1175 length:981 start_codon:yes stop_codon:yes gene_type:complete